MTDVSRRRVLQGVAAGVTVTGLAGEVGATGGTNRHIVGLTADAGFDVARDRATSVRTELDFDDIGKAVAGVFPDAALEALQQNPQVRYVEEDSTYEALAQTLPWGIDRVDADLSHDDGFTGSGADIGIIDTGIDDDHPDLQGNIGTGRCFADECCGEASGGLFCSPNSNDCNYAWSDDNDHGTHCAGSADAIDNAEDVVGVSTEATLHAAKVLNGCGSGSLSAVADGITWVADQGYDVGSMSLGADSGDQTLQDACQYAYDNGVLLVAAAGNDGPCSDCVGYPAAYSTVIAVSATTEDDSLADFSSTGPEVELAAPGKDVLSTVPPESSSDGTDTFSGTSMACPHVSGAGGLLMAEGQTNTEARSALQDTAEDIGLADNEQGYGLLDAEAATNSLGGNGSPTVDSLSAAEVETSDSDAEFDVEWSVSDSDGNLDSVDLTLTDDTDSETEDTASISVSGDTASGTTRLVAAGDDGSGNSYTVEAVVTDTDGASDTATTTVSESEDTSSAPTIDSWTTSTRTSGPWFRVESNWDVSDSDGDLDTVTTELLDSGGSVLDSSSSSVSGSTASGTHRVKSRSTASDVRLTVTDAAGNTTTDTRTV